MPSLATKPLGVFDSGVGGLTVVNALRRALPQESLLYLGDTARVPYGSKPLEMVRGFARQISAHLLQRGVKGIVIACNTASAASLPALADELPVPVWGVVQPGVDTALATTRGGRVGVLGTVGTIHARVYQDRLEAAGAATWGKACPLFVPIVEEGISDTRIAEMIAEYYLRERPAEIDTVILGCTHYPALARTLQKVLGDGVMLVDSAESTAAVVARDLRSLGLTAPLGSPAGVVHLVTGDVAAYLHTAAVLGGPDGPAEHVSLAGLTPVGD